MTDEHIRLSSNKNELIYNLEHLRNMKELKRNFTNSHEDKYLGIQKNPDIPTLQSL